MKKRSSGNGHGNVSSASSASSSAPTPKCPSNSGGNNLRDKIVEDCCHSLIALLQNALGQDNSAEASVVTIEQLVENMREKAAILEKRIPARKPPPRDVHQRCAFSPSLEPPTVIRMPNIYHEKSILTAPDILAIGLQLAGFDAIRQGRVKEGTNIERFKAFFGVPPTTVAPLFVDMKGGEAGFEYNCGFMALNWLYLYDTYPVLAGRFHHHENYIGVKVIEYTKRIQKLCRATIRFTFNSDSPYPFTLDTVNFLCNEMRLGTH